MAGRPRGRPKKEAPIVLSKGEKAIIRSRAAGVPAEKTTSQVLKEAIAQSFDLIGGIEWLVRLAKEQPKSYVMLLAKMIPQTTQVVDDQGNNTPLQINIVYKKIEDTKYVDADLIRSTINTSLPIEDADIDDEEDEGDEGEDGI